SLKNSLLFVCSTRLSICSVKSDVEFLFLIYSNIDFFSMLFSFAKAEALKSGSGLINRKGAVSKCRRPHIV
ncbi:MAG: hypothetical protein IIX63_05660, partial [Treponema sp.]|nr:hypothetical protein [Treponema sp.]